MDNVHGFHLWDIQLANVLQVINICLQKLYNVSKSYIITLLPSLQPPVRPGQPRSADIGADHICLEWDKVEKDDVSNYEIRMKMAGNDLWSNTVVFTQGRKPFHRFNELPEDTGYEFMVRAVYSDGRASDFSNKSVKITTVCSRVCGILKYCKKVSDGPPSVYRLPLVEMTSAKDDVQKTRKVRYGNSTCLREKTLLMVGPGKGGKTTLINGLVNHILGVKWEHKYRLKITDEPEVTSSGQESPTEWITSYKVHPVTTDTDFILNIIDTPSFQEGPGSDASNQNLLQRLKFFLSTRGPKGMNGIDAVCFVSQANPIQYNGINDAFSATLDGIVSMFGDNMHGNIIPMLTFADGKEPSALTILSAVGVPTQHYFAFNNSTLFPTYTEDALLGKTLWKLSSRGVEGFLKHLSSLRPCRAFKTTPMTTSQRTDPDWQQEKMTHLQGNRSEINVQLMDLATVQADRDTVKKFAIDIQISNSFTYDEEVYRQEKIPLAPGTHVTNCIVCHTTCHYPCQIPDNEGKIRCAAMNNGYCTVCHQKCVWHVHRNDTFRIEGKFETITKTYSDIKAKYEFNVEDNVLADAMLQAIKRAFVSLLEEVISLISKTVDTSNILQGIQQSEHDYIELMITTEEQEQKPGYKQRLELLRAIHNNTKVCVGDPNTWLQELGFRDW